MNRLPHAIRFCATSRSGLGHLRRVTNIARALRAARCASPFELFSNSKPGGLTDTESCWYARMVVAERREMTAQLASGAGPVVVDTAVIPGVETVAAPLCLVLRESKPGTISRFALPGGRPWDLVILPSPPGRWRFDRTQLAARRVSEVGWIYRKTAARDASPLFKTSTLLIATGGGGSGPAWSGFRAYMEHALAQLRTTLGASVRVVQVMGPRAGADARLANVDEFFSPGAELPKYFASADAIVSTAGYNSTLELALTRTPVLFVPIPATYDDQYGRARFWAHELGFCHDENRPDESTDWLIDTLRKRRRRAAVKLAPSGEAAAARQIMRLAS